MILITPTKEDEYKYHDSALHNHMKELCDFSFVFSRHQQVKYYTGAAADVVLLNQHQWWLMAFWT